MSKAKRPNLIYILSSGRSGSTILDMILGSSENCWTLGELHLLPFELRNDHLPCSCGEKIQSCPFWSKIIPHEQQFWLEGNPPIDLFRNKEARGKVIRWEYLSSILFPHKNTKIENLSIRYGNNNLGVLNKILTIAKQEKPTTEYLVDSSKDLYRLLLLKLSTKINIKVIHLTKQPQGFVYSMTKPKMSFLNICRMSGRWAIENYLMNRLGSALFDENSFYHLKYEDLVTKPDSILNDLSQKLSLSISNTKHQNLTSLHLHGIAGNIARFKTKPLTPDFEWKKKMNIRKQKLVDLFTFFTAKKLKY